MAPQTKLRQSFAAFVLCVACIGTAQNTPTPVTVSGTVRDHSGTVAAYARVTAGSSVATTDAKGRYVLTVPPGSVRLAASLHGQPAFAVTLNVEEDRSFDITLHEGENVTVRAEGDALTPDPATQGFSRADLLDANPGRPGVPLSIPGYPTETASGGIKAPQYFAPGVAGDHGEPIAQFFSINGFLFQNNLTANAHGNGYSDPNFAITPTIGGVIVDNAAYNARYGDHSLNLAVTYDVREHIAPFIQAVTDGRDGALAAGWSPANAAKHEWVAAEAMFGNGYLQRPEERQQYKVNALRTWQRGRHELTAYGVGYYGFSRIPGLIPIDTPVPDDTIDLRQLDLTHTSLALVTDRWQRNERQQLTLGAYFRTYSLKLQSNFGEGLIRQSEFRTVEGADATYSQPLSGRWSLLAGLDARRDAPRGLDLAHADDAGRFQLVTRNDLTITDLGPFAAVSGQPRPWLQVYVGLRRDQIHFGNRDNFLPANGFNTWPGVTSPKINVTFGRPDAAVLPQVSFSFGKAFHANDPRIGTGTGRGELVIDAREFQAFVIKQVRGTELRLTLAYITNSAELAKIDPDTGLQEDVGPSLNRFLTVAAVHRLSRGLLEASWSQADARDRQTRAPVPEAPRTIIDVLGSLNRLPGDVSAKAEYEYVKAKPLGDGFNGVPLQETRLSLTRAFADGRWLLGLQGQLTNGYTGQTLETLRLGSEPAAFERRVGVPTRSYASLSAVYNFAR